MKIHVHLDRATSQGVNALQLFDFYYAYCQAQNSNNNFQVDLDIKIAHNLPWDSQAVNIGFFYMPESKITSDKFDLVLVDAGQHHLEVCTEYMHEAVTTLPNCYYICGSYVDKDYPLHHKIITFPFYVQYKDLFTRPYYPQYYQISKNINKTADIIWINGMDRPQRRFVRDLLLSHNNPQVYIKSTTFASNSSKLWDSFFETAEDTKFREFVNNYCPIKDNIEEVENTYYDNSISVGIDQKFGRVPPGFFILDEYLKYRCVIYPETTWLNDEVFLTEKIAKASLTRTIPWPIAGANIDILYDQLGFKTAWHLLPDSLKLYTYEKNHEQRYRLCAEAIDWLGKNSHLLTSELAEEIVENNYNNWYSTKIDAMGVGKFDLIVKEIENKKQRRY